ncbi:MAG: diguanylate cyclase [Firmicutes bacterium]|nr:diguanylate cyclase [Bacillota bacterium]
MSHRNPLFWSLIGVSLIGDTLALLSLFMLPVMMRSVHLVSLAELILLGLWIMPWVAKMPSGSSWRPGIPLMTMAIFLVPPEVVPLVPLLGLIRITYRAKAPWWKYAETIGHVSLSLAAGAWTYAAMTHLIGGRGLWPTVALVPALLVHLLVNRTISAMIVSYREHRPLREQLLLTVRELHWGYMNAYALIVLSSMTAPGQMRYAIIMIAILQASVFLAISHYSRIEEMQKSMGFDGLTGVENRAAWEKLVASTAVSGTQLYMLDVNDFKAINDRYGHLLGDQVLRLLAQDLGHVLPRGARCFRVGGDEFVVLTNGRAEAWTERLHEHLRKPHAALAMLDRPLTVSVGVATVPDDGTVIRQLFDVADKRMYEHKRSSQHTEELDFGLSSSVCSLILAVEAKDPYTSSHSLRVGFYSWQLARYMGLSEEAAQSVFRAGLVHDVGKIGIPDSLLTQQRAMTPEQVELIRRHAETGYQICRNLGFTQKELEVIRYHHERFDGTGYPEGRTNEEIPLLARIVGLVDVYDALLSKRSYREPWSHEAALAYLYEQQGVLFDPECVASWLALNDREPQLAAFLAWVEASPVAQRFREEAAVTQQSV